MSSKLKIQEAAFFIELLHALQERGSSLTHIEDKEAEASFLYAAILNAFYSVVEVMRHEGHEISTFKTQHPMIYAYASKGGERAKTVHLSHTKVDLAGYEPPPSNKVAITFRNEPKLAPKPPKVPGIVNLVFKPEYYFYVELLGQRVNALEFCEEHYSALASFNKTTTAT